MRFQSQYLKQQSVGEACEDSSMHSHVLDALILILIPVSLLLCALFQVKQAALLTFAVAILGIVLFFVRWDHSAPDLKIILPTVVLGAIAALSRILFAVIPSVQPVTAICIIAGIVFGRKSGFLVGAIAALVSNFALGQGVWTSWQMYSWGVIGYLAGIMGSRSNTAVCIYGFCASYLFGFIMNTWSLVGFIHPITWQSALVLYGASIALDTAHAISTVVFLWALYLPWKKKLLRIKAKYRIEARNSCKMK